MFPAKNYSLCVIGPNEIDCKSTFITSETSVILRNLELDTNYSVTITVFTDIGESPASERIPFAIGLYSFIRNQFIISNYFKSTKLYS